MKSQKFRVLETDNKTQYVFSTQKFKECCDEYIRNKSSQTGKRALKKDLWEKLAEATSVSLDSVHAWHTGSNGPGDVSYVEAMARILGVNYRNMLEVVPGENEGQMNTRKDSIPAIEDDASIFNSEKEIVIGVYRQILDFDRSVSAQGGDQTAFVKHELSFINNHALELSKNSYLRLRTILVEYLAHFSHSGCFRWQEIAGLHKSRVFDFFSDYYRDYEWFDGEELEEWSEGVRKMALKELVPAWKIRYIATNHWYSGYVDDPDDMEAVTSFIDAYDRYDDKYDGSELYISPEYDYYEDGLYDVFEDNGAYTWAFEKMLSDVFRHDFPEFFDY